MHINSLQTNLQGAFLRNCKQEDIGIILDEITDRLAMANRTYLGLDYGKTGCCALTLALFLIYICTDLLAFLEEVQNTFKNSDYKTA